MSDDEDLCAAPQLRPRQDRVQEDSDSGRMAASDVSGEASARGLLGHFGLFGPFGPAGRVLAAVVLVMLVLPVPGALGCSARSTPKPRPASHASAGAHSAIRPNITFQTYACPPAYTAWYCLNGATCFTVKIADSILYNCECADGFMGQRCEFKDLEGSYLPSRERLFLPKDPRVVHAFVGVFLIVVSMAILSAIFTRCRTARRRTQHEEATQSSAHESYSRSSESFPEQNSTQQFTLFTIGSPWSGREGVASEWRSDRPTLHSRSSTYVHY